MNGSDHSDLLGLTNLTRTIGDALSLTFPHHSFTRVVTRYSFHHFIDPERVFAEMVRVCRPGGRVTVCDVFTKPRSKLNCTTGWRSIATHPIPMHYCSPTWSRSSSA